MVQMEEIIDALKARGYDSRFAHAYAFGAAWTFLTEKQKQVILETIKKNSKEAN